MMQFNCKFLEKENSSSGEGKRFKVILLQEGLGNFGTAYYYTKEALQSAVEIFEGAKSFADHPTKIEDEVRPERSVRDQIGHFEEVKIEDVDGRANLVGEFVRVEGSEYDWVKDQLLHSIDYSRKYPEKDFIGLSINASGDSKETPIDDIIKKAPQVCVEKLNEAKSLGIKYVQVTNKIENCISCDLVTSAGAGGAVKTLIEGDTPMAKDHDDETKDKELIKSMLKKHGVDGQEEACHALHKQYKSAGMKQEEAAEAAAIHLKISKKKKESESEEDEEEKKKKEARKKEDEDEKKKEDEDEKKKKESTIAELAGRVAFLESSLKNEKLSSHMEKSFKESGFDPSTISFFKKTTGEFKDQNDFDERFSEFTKGFKGLKENKGFSKVKDSFEAKEDDIISFSDCVK